MSTTVSGGPDIVTDGLVFSIDPANKRSYPGTGTTWSDISGHMNNGTLTNGPTFDSGNGGSIVFDGTNDSVIGTSSSLLSFGNGSSDTPFSLTVWAYLHSTSSFPLISKYRSYSPFRGEYSFGIVSGKLNFQCVDGGATTRVRRISTGVLSTNTWYNIVATYNGNSTDGGITEYVNGQVFPSDGANQGVNYVAMERAGDPSELTVGVYLDEGNTAYQANADGKISNAQVYNKELTAQEVLQNYNATKNRFI